MPWFKCFVEGINFPGVLIGEPGLVGFCTTRFVEASTPELAEQEVLAALRFEPSLQLPLSSSRPAEARVAIVEIDAVESNVVPQVRQGFAFYRMESGEGDA